MDSLICDLRLPGQLYMAETGLNYNYYRDLDTSTGRYVESDPSGLRGGLNTYAYALADPVDRKDPTGLAGISGSTLNDIIQNVPFTLCEWYSPACYKHLRVCTKALCKKCGVTWIVDLWLPDSPSPEEVSKETPECQCIEWKPGKPE
jgi:RHS repeat-associated protein